MAKLFEMTVRTVFVLDENIAIGIRRCLSLFKKNNSPDLKYTFESNFSHYYSFTKFKSIISSYISTWNKPLGVSKQSMLILLYSASALVLGFYIRLCMYVGR